MQIVVRSNAEKREVHDALVIPFWKGGEGPIAAFEVEHFKEVVTPPIAAKDFEGKPGEVVRVWGHELEEKRILLFGLGEKEKCSSEELRRGYAALCRYALKNKIESLNIFLPRFDTLQHKRGVVEGLYFGSYVFDALKSKQEKRLERVTLTTDEMHATSEVCEHSSKIMQAVFMARDLINGNADDITPHYLGTVALGLKEQYPLITGEVYDKKWIEDEKMGLLLAVSRASFRDPVFISLHYNGSPTSSDRTALVGKGVTYDTGGLNLKPTGSMETMRSDMSASAILLGVMQACAALRLPINLSVVIPCTENAIGSRAYKPGDVYKSRSGTMVEITNTDAEGRLILADALSYTVDVIKPNRIIDVATLTGAMRVALGHETMGLFSNSDSLAEELLQAGLKTHERAWRFPLYEEYKEELKSDLADIKNAAGREGGAILAALFLQDFVGGIPWAHFDIAGVSYLKDARRYLPKYATATGVRLLVEYLEHVAKSQI